jgi:hypothetical protein
MRLAALLLGLRLIIRQDLIDDAQPRPQFRTLHRLLALVRSIFRNSCVGFPSGSPVIHRIFGIS